jgi:predicted  nucleic acid-binding Zn-ribbon protein
MWLRAHRLRREKRIEDRAAERAREDLRHAAIDAKLLEHEGRISATDAGIAGVRQELAHQTTAITSRLDQLILAFLGRSESANHPHHDALT